MSSRESSPATVPSTPRTPTSVQATTPIRVNFQFVVNRQEDARSYGHAENPPHYNIPPERQKLDKVFKVIESELLTNQEQTLLRHTLQLTAQEIDRLPKDRLGHRIMYALENWYQKDPSKSAEELIVLLQNNDLTAISQIAQNALRRSSVGNITVTIPNESASLDEQDAATVSSSLNGTPAHTAHVTQDQVFAIGELGDGVMQAVESWYQKNRPNESIAQWEENQVKQDHDVITCAVDVEKQLPTTADKSTSAHLCDAAGYDLVDGVRKVKPRIDQVFVLEDQAAKLMRSDELDKAFNVFNSRSRLGAQLRDAVFLVNFHVCCVKTSHYEHAARLSGDLTQLIVNFVEASGESTRRFADELKEDGKYFEANLFFGVAASLYGGACLVDEAALGISSCVLGMRESCDLLVGKTGKRFLHNIQHYTVKVMNDLRERIPENCTDLEIRLAWCRFNVAHVEGLVKDHKSEEQSLKQALDLLEETLGDQAPTRHVYGMCLHNYALNHYNQSRYSLALDTFKAAVEAKETAEDYQSPAVRLASVELSEKAARQVKRRSRLGLKGF